MFLNEKICIINFILSINCKTEWKTESSINQDT
jgi:hypothetical protein